MVLPMGRTTDLHQCSSVPVIVLHIIITAASQATATTALFDAFCVIGIMFHVKINDTSFPLWHHVSGRGMMCYLPHHRFCVEQSTYETSNHSYRDDSDGDMMSAGRYYTMPIGLPLLPLLYIHDKCDKKRMRQSQSC
jgi:hypothetical protein